MKMVTYKCGTCQRTGCKLWRPSACFPDQTDLICAQCMGQNVDENGKVTNKYGMHTDQVNGLLPCVPNPHTELDINKDAPLTKVWGYTSVDEAGVAWWKSLPN